MLLARAFDTKISSLYKAGKITGGVYLGRGHEAIAACGGVFLTAGYDVIAPFIREQAARVTWGEPIIEAARAYLGSALGYMKGRDGNVHRGLPAEGYMAPISHLGSTVAFVIGCLFAKRLDGKLPGPVGVAFCGDGTTSTGAFHEAANMANVERLPLVLVVTNNQFAYSTPNIREFGEASLADRGRGYGFTVHETDGTDFMATLETFRTAVNNAREGRGPQWVLAKTLRMCGHGEHDDASYIPRELKEEYEKKDPVAVAERQLLAAGWLTPEETISPSPMEAPPLGRILKLLCKDAITISNFSASTVDIENSKTKKQRSKFIRSLNVAIHAGAPAGASSVFFLATMLHLRLLHHLLRDFLLPVVSGMISAFLQ